MATSGSYWFWDDGIIEWFDNTDLTEEATSAFEDMADEIVSFAQSNAPWTDRTGDARSGLTAEVIVEGSSVVLELYHTVDYGQWLETIQNGDFATIMPTLEQYAPEVFARVATNIRMSEGGSFS